MIAATANSPSNPSLPQGWYVQSGMPQHVYFRMASNCFQARSKTIGEKDTFSCENGPQDAIPRAIYLHSNDALDRVEKNVKRLEHRYPIQLEENEYLKRSTAQTKEGCLNIQQMRPGTVSAETKLHNEPPEGPPKSIQKFARDEIVHECPACLPIKEFPDIEARRSLGHFESTQRSHARVHQNGHPDASENVYLPQRSEAYLKPSGYQTQPPGMQIPVHLVSGIQSNSNLLGSRYPTKIKNLRVPLTHRKPTYYSQPMWQNLAQVPFTHSGHSYSEVRPKLVRENREPDANSVKRQPLNVVASNSIQPTLPLSNSLMPSGHHPSSRSNYYAMGQMTADSSSASIFSAVQAPTVISSGFNHSVIPAASPYYPQGINPLSRGENEKDAILNQRHVRCESRKRVTAAFPDYKMNAVQTDVQLVSHPPARQLPISTPKDASENPPQKSHFPVQIVYVPPNGASRVTSPRPSHRTSPNGQSCFSEGYNTWDANQPVSANASQSLKTNANVQYNTSNAPIQVNDSEGPMKVPIQYSYRSTFEGFCRHTRKETSAPNHGIDSMNSVPQETSPPSKSNAPIVAQPRGPNYVSQAICQPVSAQSLTTSNLPFTSMIGDIPEESRNTNPKFDERGKGQGDPYSRVRPWIVSSHQPHNQNSGNGFKYGGPLSWSNDASGHASPHITRGYQTTLPSLSDSLTTTEEPHCYTSVYPKPQQGYRKKREFSKAATRCREMVQSREDRTPFVDQEQQAKQLEMLTKFVVGVETKIHWNKVWNNNENSNRFEEQDMQITSVSSNYNSRDDPTGTHCNLSQRESDDAFCRMRLERVYYSINAIPSPHAQSSFVSQKQASEPRAFDVDSHKGNLTNPRVNSHQMFANYEYSSVQSSSIATINKTSKDLSLDMKVHKNAQLPDSCPVKRKANVSSTKRDEVYYAKQKKMEMTVQLESDSETFLGDLKSKETDARILRGRIRKRCVRKVRINS